jgi:hypothetical protein
MEGRFLCSLGATAVTLQSPIATHQIPAAIARRHED